MDDGGQLRTSNRRNTVENQGIEMKKAALMDGFGLLWCVFWRREGPSCPFTGGIFRTIARFAKFVPRFIPQTHQLHGQAARLAVFTCALPILSALCGCATKNFGSQAPLTDVERQTLTCREISLEQAKVMGFAQQVDRESRFDGRDILAALGDFGIGNSAARSSAIDSAKLRYHQLEAVAYEKGCTTTEPDPLPPTLQYGDRG